MSTLWYTLKKNKNRITNNMQWVHIFQWHHSVKALLNLQSILTMMFFQHFQREQMLEAQEMFRTSNIVTRPEKALILGFMAGSRGEKKDFF
jgi:hypothetical protein